MIKRFSQVRNKDVALVGGKGASLGELKHHGFPYANGFVLTTDAFGRNHQERVHEVYKAFDQLDTKYVAVRSSATKEDSVDDSFAGQFETYLFVDRENLIEQIMECHHSVYSDRIKAYCASKGIDIQDIKVAVVIQKMINSETAGVAFTVNPVTNDSDEIMVEAGRGMGEAVVSGMITPDNYLINKTTQDIQKTISTQSIRLVIDTDNGGIKKEHIEETHQSTQKISDIHIQELVDLCIKIEKHYGKPMDIERAIEDGELYILQARPITTITQNKQSGQIFVKAYTRNFSIIMQQAWFAANKQNIISILGLEEYPYNPPYIYFMQDGVEEVRENTKANKRLHHKIIEKITSDQSFFLTVYNRYFEKLHNVKKQWNKEIDNIHDLEIFIDQVYAIISDFVILYETLMSNDLPDDIKKLSEEFRKEDVLFAECNIVIMKSLQKIYPNLGYLSVYITREELNKNNNEDILQQRDQGFALIPGIYQGNISFKILQQKFPEYYFKEEQGEIEGNSLKGQIAYQGKISGTVKIVKRADQIKNVQKGDIIVSPMTTPDFVPAMERAAAFITDEGGLTCHAAIIAREMQKPCIIGTKTATGFFNNGDIVEVDAINGVAKIIKQENRLEIGGIEWEYNISRNIPIFHQSMICQGYYHGLKQYFGLTNPIVGLCYIENFNSLSVFTTPQSAKNISNELLTKIKEPGFIKKTEKAYYEYGQQLNKASKQLLEDITHQNFMKFKKLYTLYGGGLYVSNFIGRAATPLLLEKLQQKGYIPQEASKILGYITYPKENTPLTLSQLSLLHIIEENQTKNLSDKQLENKLIDWLENYGFIPVSFSDKPRSIDDAYAQLQALAEKNYKKEIDTIHQSHRLMITNGEKRLDKINDKEITQLAYALQKSTTLNEYRKNVFSKVGRDLHKIMQNINTSIGLEKREYLYYLTSDEIESVIAQNLSNIPQVIKERDSYGFYCDQEGSLHILSQKERKEIIQFLKKEKQSKKEKHGKAGILKGMSANQGKIQGKVKIILSAKDFHKMNEGDILVTTMTSVDFVPVMAKAAAFVTNEGGVTSHAAIVSREMNKPCIIGTQHATDILQNNDIVEVDADNGIVKIIT